MFILYINDLHRAIDHSETYHFADDTCLLNKSLSRKELNKNTNHDLSKLVNWLRCNKISLNASKTEIIIFKGKNEIITKKWNFRISGQKLTLKNHVKYLGIYLDEHLSWKKDIDFLTQKLSRSVGILSKLRHSLSYTSLIQLYYAIFDSHTSYHLPVLGNISVEYLNSIKSLQNKAIRIIHFKKNTDTVLPLYIQSKILPIEQNLKLKSCLFAQSQLSDRIPKFFSNYLTPLGNNHNHNTNRVVRLAFDFENVNNIQSTITTHWNEIVPHLKLDDRPAILTKGCFKKHIKAYLIDKLAD